MNSIAVAATRELLLSAGPARLDGVRVIGVDEHRWAHTRHAAGEGYVTVIVQHGVERVRELPDAVADQEPEPADVSAELHHEPGAAG